jgi:hypothetical protein
MLIRVMYTDQGYDYVGTHTLDQLIAAKHITKFVRPSEHEWVDIARHPIRGTKEVTYIGPERRVSQLKPAG